MMQSNQNITNISAEKVALGPLLKEHLHVFWRWFNDLEVMATYSIRWSPMTHEALEQWYMNACDNRQTVSFTVYDVETMKPIGYCMLLNVNHYHQTADLDIIIGEKPYWGRGCGTEAIRLILDYGFTALNLHNIMLTVRSYNERGLRAYQRAGFRVFGRRREARQYGGKHYDAIYMECLSTEFESPYLRHVLPNVVTDPHDSA